MNDIKKHIIAGLGIALLVALPVYLESTNLFCGLWGCLAGVVAGGVKEWCDNKTQFNEWSWKDLGWTCLGAVLAAVFIALLHVAKG